MTDSELLPLLIEELQHHAEVLQQQEMDTETLRQVLHAIAGTSGIAGELFLSESFARLGRQIGHSEVTSLALQLLQSAIANLEANLPALVDPWPVPPAEIQARAEAASSPTEARYKEDIRDRVSDLQDIGVSNSPLRVRLSDAMRHVHAMKGAGSALGDDAMAWFCHGLETQLRSVQEDESAMGAMMNQLEVWRPVLLGLVDDSAGTLELLRRAGRDMAGSKDWQAIQSVHPKPDDETLLHVPARVLDLALERLRRISRVARDVRGQGEATRKAARRLRTARQQLLESRRMIGPSRPWGAPALALEGIESATRAIGTAAVDLEALATTARRGARTIGKSATMSQNELGSVRRATMALVFNRVSEAIESSAEHAGVEVQVLVFGASTAVDRRLAENLIDPVLQLARNAVAHGIESPSLRTSMGKPRQGRVQLSAEVHGAHLLVGVRDDGAGVDVDALRADAFRTGRLTRQAAREISDEGLLNLLFLPGITTRRSADILAGRGLGLDVALHMARRLGGTIRLRNRPGKGLTAIVDVPLIELGQARVLWVQSLENRFALTARYVRNVRRHSPQDPLPPTLATWIDPRLLGREEGYVLDIGRSEDGQLVSFSVGAIEGIEETTVRPVPPLVALAGPYVGVIVAGDGQPSLLIDALLVSDRATRGQGRRMSSFPPVALSDR